jgi:hypothetical protein
VRGSNPRPLLYKSGATGWSELAAGGSACPDLRRCRLSPGRSWPGFRVPARSYADIVLTRCRIGALPAMIAWVVDNTGDNPSKGTPMMGSEVNYDDAKLRELILYVAARMGEDPSFGATKLNKVLFFADFFHYAEHGTPITGAEYQKLKYGPAPRQLLPVQHALIVEKAAALRHGRVGPYRQKRLIPLREPDLSRFTGTEIALVDQIITALTEVSAVEVSEFSHRMVGWKIADEGATIPYDSVFLYDGPLTDSDRQHAQAIAERLHPELQGAGIS